MIMSTDTEKHPGSSSTIQDKNFHKLKIEERGLKPTKGV